MAKHMIIAPGHSIDRTWWSEPLAGVVHFMPVLLSDWDPDGPQGSPMPTVETATLRRYWHPSWKVLLGFYVHDALQLRLPLGYVMPGWINGVPVAHFPQCRMEDRP